MISAHQITNQTSQQDLASFLKSTTADQYFLLSLNQVQILEITINDAYSVPLQPNQRQRTDVQEMLKTRKSQIFKRKAVGKQLQIILERKKQLQNWKLAYILALFVIMVYIANPLTNKITSVQYQFDNTGKQNSITKIQVIIFSGWLCLWKGILVIVAIIISLCAFIDTEVVCCGIKLKGVIPRQRVQLEERQTFLVQVL